VFPFADETGQVRARQVTGLRSGMGLRRFTRGHKRPKNDTELRSAFVRFQSVDATL